MSVKIETENIEENDKRGARPRADGGLGARPAAGSERSS